MVKDHVGHRRTAGCGRVSFAFCATWKAHTQEEARDHDAENQDEDHVGHPVAHHAWKKPDTRLPEVVAQFGVVM